MVINNIISPSMTQFTASVLASQKNDRALVFSSRCVVRLVFCSFACAGLMPKKLSSVENFRLFKHMITSLKAFENVVIKTSQQMACF